MRFVFRIRPRPPVSIRAWAHRPATGAAKERCQRYRQITNREHAIIDLRDSGWVTWLYRGRISRSLPLITTSSELSARQNPPCHRVRSAAKNSRMIPAGPGVVPALFAEGVTLRPSRLVMALFPVGAAAQPASVHPAQTAPAGSRIRRQSLDNWVKTGKRTGVWPTAS